MRHRVSCDGFDRRDEGPEAEGSWRSSPSAVRRVLVVDDNRDAADVLAEVVRLLGHVADVSYDGSSAVERARKVAYDVVLCDIGLPGMSGYEVAAALRDEGIRARLVAVSAYDQREAITRALSAGFEAYVVKPPDLDVIERLLSDG
jgi:CheY-like chemotaxis protein